MLLQLLFRCLRWISLVSSDVQQYNRLIVRSFLFRGIGHTSSSENVLVAKVLTTSGRAISVIPGKKPTNFVSNIQLVSAVQARCVWCKVCVVASQL